MSAQFIPSTKDLVSFLREQDLTDEQKALARENIGAVDIDTVSVNVKHFGAKGDGTTNDTTAIQNAIDAVKNFNPGGVVFFPVGHYKCNVVVNGTKPVTLRGEGQGSLLSSVSSNQFAVRFETQTGVNRVQNLRYFGNGKTSHGLYINCVSFFEITDCSFYDCSLAMALNATIDTRFSHVLFEQNFCGLYFTTRKTGNLTVNINGTNYTFSNANLDSHPGEVVFSGVSFNQNSIGMVVDQPDAPQAGFDLKWYGGLLQGNAIGLLYLNIGSVGTGKVTSHYGVWQEANGSASSISAPSFNSVSYPHASVYQNGGYTKFIGGGIDEIVLRNSALLCSEHCANYEASAYDIDSTSSLISESCVTSNRTTIPGYANFVVPELNYGCLFETKPFVTFSSKAFTPASFNRCYSNDSFTMYGAGSQSNVADGVLPVEECKEVTITTAGNGPILFSTTGHAANSYSVGIFAIKRVSGLNTVRLEVVDGNAPFGTHNIAIDGTWKTYAIVTSKQNSSSSASSNFLSIPSATTTVVRLSAVACLQFQKLSDVFRFLDSGCYPSLSQSGAKVSPLTTKGVKITEVSPSVNETEIAAHNVGDALIWSVGGLGPMKVKSYDGVVAVEDLSGNGGRLKAATLQVTAMPTSNPGPGILWNDGGTVKVGT